MIVLVQQEKKLLTLAKQIQFCFSLHYNGDDSYLYVNETKISNNKTNNGKNNISLYSFCLGSVSNYFTNNE